ncbi:MULTISPECIES: acetyltransferase [Alteribacter]|uniref:Acetyltransferase n=1 Tax=Alteribacter keqinensis TaxID=2483800 RepID=A0A3M7TMS4_9BACI|nr:MULTISPECIES: acetyltransferase [Alteribacter]MBM7094958.1 acetyltransferase [Alteribacter salitolerans]RNA66762.1 acetyltransferase [Alteribacter keqinensis]
MIGVIGAGGHAKTAVAIIQRCCSNEKIVFFSDSSNSFFKDYQLFPADLHSLLSMQEKIHHWHIALGDIQKRKRFEKELTEHNLPLKTLVHPGSIIEKSVDIGHGSIVVGGAIINSCSTIGKCCIINTAATIDHDCSISDFVNIGPGCHLAGNVEVGKETDIGTGAIIIPGIKVGRNCKIGAGAVIISDIPEDSMAVGVPARIIRRI